MRKKHFLFGFIGLLAGLSLLSPLRTEGIAMPSSGAFTGSAASALASSEDNYVVPTVTSGDYDEGTHRDCEGARHEHTHINNSSTSGTYDYYDVIHATAITLEDDFWDYVDTTNLLCTDGDDTYVDCGFDKDTVRDGEVLWSTSGGEWDGVTVTYYDSLGWISGHPRGIVWEYGTSHPGDITYLPWEKEGHQKTEGISWSALTDYTADHTVTTTSWTKEEFYYIRDTADHSDLDNYTHLYTDDVEPYKDDVDPDGDYLYWYGLNGTTVSNFIACEAPEITCESLDLSKTDGTDVTVADLYSTVPLTVTAIGSDGSDITADSTFQYYANAYGSSNTAGDASGTLHYGWFSTSKHPNTTDSTISFSDVEPGDSVYVYVSDYEGAAYPSCYDRIEFPYCADLSITDPTGLFGSSFIGIYTADSFNTNITVEATASTGEAWPYEITYDSTDDTATYDGESDPYHTEDYTVDDYESTESARVTVSADNDVASACTDSFNYTLIPTITLNTCQDLSFTTVGPISADDMAAGNVEISWTSTMTDGTPTPPPYVCMSINNPTGSFRDPSGLTSTGSITTSSTTVYYTGNAGDIVTCSSSLYPACTDMLTSETTTTTYSCNELSLSEPYITTDGGVTKTTIDLEDEADVALLFDNTTVCYDYTLGVSNAAFSDTLQAAGYEDSTRASTSGNLQLTVNEMPLSSTGNPLTDNPGSGNPVTVAISGHTSYTGTVCWENFQPGNYLDLQVLGAPLMCYDDSQLPTPSTTSYACTDLELSPDSVTIASGTSTAGAVTLTVTVTGNDAAWSGNLLVTHTGSGTLYYADGTISSFGDGHLEVPVSGLTNTLTFTYVDGMAGDTVTAVIEGEVGACTDNLTMTQETSTGGGGCTDCGPGGSSSSGGGGNSSPEEVCEVDVTEHSEDTVLSCEDYEMKVCVEGDDVTVTASDNNEICYYLDEDGDGRQDSDEELTCDDGSVELDQDNDCYEVTVNNVCEETDISIENEAGACYDTTVETTGQVGTFNKYIYTFNFSSEKNSYSEEGVFFAHDEDRAFYTLDYKPSGDEGAIVFTDDMWTGDLSSSDGGYISLATDYSELTNGSAYRYSTILNYGFGDTHEEHSDELLNGSDGIKATYTNLGNYPSFIPYIKYDNGSNSTLIDACAYDEDGNLFSTDVCFDPGETPEGSHQVTIENAGTVSGASIRIRYVGVIHSNLDCSGSSGDTCLTEEFQNDATVDAFPGTSGNTVDASARLVVLCAYLLTENAGDVYLNEAIQGGSDLACIYVDENNDYTSYSNTDSLIFLDPDSTSSTSPTSTGTIPDYSDDTISWCDGNSDGSLIGNLSSYVCEIVGSVSELWRTATVETTTESHVSQATRNASTNQTSSTLTINGGDATANWQKLEETLANNNNLSSHILYFDGNYGGATHGTLTLYSVEVPAGAWTIIVENADLKIAGDISYADTLSTADYKNLPSVAFVVMDGDIQFETSSYHNVGVYYTNQDLTGETRSPVNGVFTIDGSIYGNVQPLVDACRYVAPPTMEGGGLVVRYDSRILLNTPPSLSEYVDVSTEKAIN